MELHLTEQERRALRAALEIYVRELRGEIAHTDARRLRDELKGEEETLRALLDRLADATTKPQ
jgi:hypothetical protein